MDKPKHFWGETALWSIFGIVITGFLLCIVVSAQTDNPGTFGEATCFIFLLCYYQSLLVCFVSSSIHIQELLGIDQRLAVVYLFFYPAIFGGILGFLYLGWAADVQGRVFFLNLGLNLVGFIIYKRFQKGEEGEKKENKGSLEEEV